MKNKFLTLMLFLTCGIKLYAQSGDFTSTYYDTVALFILFMIILVLFGFMYYGMGEEIKRKPLFNPGALLSKIKYSLNKSVPVEKEDEIDLGHDFDGIKELDNKIPPWFSYLFYFTIIFAVWYMIDYHVLEASPMQEEEYAQEMAIASAEKEALMKSGAFVTEENVTLLTEPGAINSGRQLYNNNCVTCHGPQGGGMVGPNLTDEYWIHGGSIQDIFKVIKYGVPQKGMISWQQQLNPMQIQEVSSFIMTLKGTTPPGAKQPEGELYN